VLDRDVTKTHVLHDGVVEVFRGVYSDVDEHWGVYEACEDLVDLEDSFQVWRFRHLRTVQRTIGFRRGTGGSSGTGFLARALDQTFFPELYAVRTELGD
jgi:tryptophan 2,3-dioxygenase